MIDYHIRMNNREGFEVQFENDELLLKSLNFKFLEVYMSGDKEDKCYVNTNFIESIRKIPV